MGFLDELRVNQEVAHTRLLAWLLNPNEDHELGDRVLSKFWRIADLSKSRRGLRSAEINIEVSQDETRADIVIITQGVYVLVENKIRWAAFNQQQIAGHAKSGKRKAKRSGKIFKLLLLLPDDTYKIDDNHHRPAIRKIRRDFQAQIISWAGLVQIFRQLDPENGLTKPPGLPFLHSYCQFVEREILKKWKGFNMQVIDKNTVTALSTYLGRKNQLLKEFRNFAESVRAGLGRWREAPRHEETEKQSPAGLLVYARRYTFRKYANTHVELSFWVDPQARSLKGLKLYLGFWTKQKDVISVFARKRLLTRSAADLKFNNPTEFDTTDQYLWIAHLIPQDRWLSADEKTADAGVNAVTALLRRYLNTTENLLGSFT
jgi:hypothetical protein